MDLSHQPIDSAASARLARRVALAEVLSRSMALDLELAPDGKGGTGLKEGFIAPAEQVLADRACPGSTASSAEIWRAAHRRDFVIGHNAALHDIPHLAALAGAEAFGGSVIDTLRLSHLSFPGRLSHALDKTYLQAGGLANDPGADTRASVQLLIKAASSLAADEPGWLRVLRWLCGLGAGDGGYMALFDALRGGDGAGDDLATTMGILASGFDGLVCRRGLQERCLAAYQGADGWPLALALAWIRAGRARAAPGPWLFGAVPGFGATLDALTLTECTESRCTRCRDRGSTLTRMTRWFPPPKGAAPGFQPPLDAGGRSYQERVMTACLRHRDVLGILPTGTGKSRCFQVAALERYAATGDLTVVISPLKSLMNDQVAALKGRMVQRAVRLHGDLGAPEREAVAAALRDGSAALLYLAPERLHSQGLRQLLQSRRVGLWVFDEAHCLSAWGNGFRGDYRRAVSWITECGALGSDAAPVVCLTATARRKTRADIAALFQGIGRDLTVIDGGAHRPNLSYEVRPCAAGAQAATIAAVLREALPAKGQAIVYAATRSGTEALAAELAHMFAPGPALRNDIPEPDPDPGWETTSKPASTPEPRGLTVAAYHAGLEATHRRCVEDGYARGEVQVLVATIAFGMGVDTGATRLVIHADPPTSLEAYAQEAGRGGRDGHPARCILLNVPDALEDVFGRTALGHIPKEEVDATWVHILNRHRRIPGTGKRTGPGTGTGTGAEGPAIALSYDRLARDVLSLHASGAARAAERNTTRITRILDALERAELIRKLPPPPFLSGIKVDTGRLAEFAKRAESLPKIEARIVAALVRRPRSDAVYAALPAKTATELADLCGLTHPDSAEHVKTASRSLHRKGLFLRDPDLAITLASGKEPSITVEDADRRETALVEALTQLLEKRAAEADAVDHMAARPGEAAPEMDCAPLTVTLNALWLTVQGIMPADDPISRVDVIQTLMAFHDDGVLQVAASRRSPHQQIVLFPRDQWPDLADRVEMRAVRRIETLEALDRLADKDRHLTISLSDLAERIGDDRLNMFDAWPERTAANRRARMDLSRQALLDLGNIGAVYVGPGLMLAFDECRIAVAPGPRRLDGFTLAKYAETLGDFQQDQIRQLHLVDGFMAQVAADPRRAPDLLNAYFAEPASTLLPRLFKGAALAAVRRNRPASVAVQARLLARVDDRQAQIVGGDTRQQDRLILAGPGSGKTRVIVERVVWLVRVERVPADQILVLCYNRRACEELRRRLRHPEALGPLGGIVSVYTYHAFAMQVTGRSFADLAEEAARRESTMSKARFQAGGADNLFGRALELASDLLKRLQGQGRDLQDILLRRYRFVFVDEFQDVTDESFGLIREISQQARKKVKSQAQSVDDLIQVRFCAVGDDDQNIYEFGGANGRYIREFTQLFPGAVVSQLTWNYRSSRAIVAAAGDVIRPAADRIDKDITVDPARADAPLAGPYATPAWPQIGKVRVLHAPTAQIADQAALAAAEMVHLSKRVADWRWDATAILVRLRDQVPVVEKALAAQGIEVTCDPRATLPFIRLREATRFTDYIGKFARTERPLTGADLIDATDWLDRRFGNRWSDAIAEWCRILAVEIDADMPWQADRVQDDFAEWARNWCPRQTGVAVMTAHTAKGLEFDNVAVLDCGWCQSGGAMDDTHRRLLYVAATRARHSLSFVTGPGGRSPSLVDLAPAPHLADPVEVEAPRAAPATPSAGFDPSTVREVFLSYPAWTSRACPQSESQMIENTRAIRDLTVGDALSLRHCPGPGNNHWHLIAGGGRCIGKMARSFQAGAARPQMTFNAKVYAIIGWNRSDGDASFDNNIGLDHWETVIPEWQPPAQPGSAAPAD